MNKSQNKNNSDIALWGPTGSGKDWLIRGFAKELEYFNREYPDFSFELYDDDNTPIITVPPSDQSVPGTIESEDFVLKFVRRPSSPKPDHPHIISAHTHNINIHNDKGANTIAGLIDQKTYEQTFRTIMNSQYVIVVLDPTYIVRGSNENKLLPENSNGETSSMGSNTGDALPSIAQKKIYTADEYTQLVQYLLLALAKEESVKNRHLAICLSKMDKKGVRGNSWDLLKRLFGQNMYDLLKHYRQVFEIEVFATSSAGFKKTKNSLGTKSSNEDKGKLIDPSAWQPVNTALPFFWIFENKEKEKLNEGRNFFSSELKDYIEYPTRTY